MKLSIALLCLVSGTTAFVAPRPALNDASLKASIMTNPATIPAGQAQEPWENTFSESSYVLGGMQRPEQRSNVADLQGQCPTEVGPWEKTFSESSLVLEGMKRPEQRSNVADFSGPDQTGPWEQTFSDSRYVLEGMKAPEMRSNVVEPKASEQNGPWEQTFSDSRYVLGGTQNKPPTERADAMDAWRKRTFIAGL